MAGLEPARLSTEAFKASASAIPPHPLVFYEILMVRAERLELSHLSVLEPKSSASANSTTPA